MGLGKEEDAVALKSQQYEAGSVAVIHKRQTDMADRYSYEESCWKQSLNKTKQRLQLAASRADKICTEKNEVDNKHEAVQTAIARRTDTALDLLNSARR